MSEGRLADVVLLDGHHLEVAIQTKQFVYELIGTIASRWGLKKEKIHFGISFRDETGHYQWLQLDKHVLDHEFPKKSGTITLYFQVKFYIESILLLMERNSIVLFYLQSKQFLCKGLIESDSETIFELSAYILQITHGDYIDDVLSRNNLKDFQLPRKILEENPSIAYCEDQIISFYKRLRGLTTGSALINYMSIVECLPTYGIHYYSVKDKSGIPWWIGVGARGIAVFDHADKKIPRKFFPWKSLENLFFRDRKFTIEVTEPKNSSKKLASSSNHKLPSFPHSDNPSVSIVVHTWIASHTNLARSVWAMAVNQHQFYLDMKHFKSYSVCPWNVEELRIELDDHFSPPPPPPPPQSSTTTDAMNSSISAPDLSSAPSSSSSSPEAADNLTLKSKSSQRNNESLKIYEELKNHKADLQLKLKEKLERLKEVCVQEAELTGCMPDDLKRFFKDDEIPQARRRIGTSFVLSSKLLDNDLNQADELTQLEIEYELQEKLATAALKLAHDKSTTKTIRKKRRQIYQMEQVKLKELERKIREHQRTGGEGGGQSHSTLSLEDIDDGVESPIQRKPALHSSLTCSQNEDPDKNSNYSNISTKSSSSSSSLPDQNQSSSSTSGITFYPKKKLSDASQCRLHHSGSGRSSSYGTREHKLMSPRSKHERRHLSNVSVKSSSRVEGRRRSNHFSKEPPGPTLQPPAPAISSRWITGVGDVTSSAYNTSTNLVVAYPSGDADVSMTLSGENGNESWKYNKYNSLDRRRKSSGVASQGGRCVAAPRRGSVELPYLIPSKYGSKRDSTLEDDDDDDDTLGRQGRVADVARTAPCCYAPNSSHHHLFCLENSPRLGGSSDSGSGRSSGTSRPHNDDELSLASRASTTSLSFTSSIQQLYNCNNLLQQQKPKLEKYFPLAPGSTRCGSVSDASSSSSTSLHFQPQQQRLEFKPPDKPSGPDKLTRVFTDVKVVGPRAAPGGWPVNRDERNEEAVDALFKHYEEKILPTRMMPTRDSRDCDDAAKQQRFV